MGIDQPTVISNRAPLPASTADDSALRILHGKLRLGDRLGHFELLDYIGGGGMGRVFRARDVRLKREVALKILVSEQSADDETLARFYNEAESAARLDHENIVRVHFIGEDQGLHYIAFEHVEGVNIRAAVEQRGPFSLAEAVSYSLQIAQALSHANQHGVVHRDIKPSNVLLTETGHVKLIDMGLARFKEPSDSGADLTASGVTLGTFDYISPEQARDPRTADIRSDIYSLGCTLFYMLAGRPPFPEGTVLQKLLQHQGDEPPDVRQFRPELPDEVARLLRKMLAKDPARRYGLPEQLIEDLLVLADAIGLRAAHSRGRFWVPPRQSEASLLRRHLPWMAPIAALFCIVALLNVYWSFISPQPSLPIPPLEAASLPEETPSGPTDAAQQPTVNPSGPNDSSTNPGTPAEVKLPVSPDGPGPGDPADVAVLPQEPAKQTTPPFAVENPAARLFSRTNDQRRFEIPGVGGGLSLARQTAGMLHAAGEMGALTGQLTAAGGAAVEPAGNGSSDDTHPPLTRTLLVTAEPEGDDQFATLAAACSAVHDGDTIELRYNGRIEERPVTLTNAMVTIRSGEGFQPVVVFRPGEEGLDPVKYPRSMFTLMAGHLCIRGVALEMDLPSGILAEHWALFSARGGQTIELQRCSLTIRNTSNQFSALHPEVAFFRVAGSPDVPRPATDQGPSLVTVDLTDCIVRGEATLMRVIESQSARLRWDNGLLVTSERLLSADHGSGEANPDDILQVDLRHVTAYVRGGLCRLAGGQGDVYPQQTQIECIGSILLSSVDTPLIEQTGGEEESEFRQRITWSGARNFYEGTDVFWVILDAQREAIGRPMDFGQWHDWWKVGLAFHRQVEWAELPSPNLPVHQHTPGDYALSDLTSDNPAIGAASDGEDAGCRIQRLPPLPSPRPEPASDNADTAPWPFSPMTGRAS